MKLLLILFVSIQLNQFVLRDATGTPGLVSLLLAVFCQEIGYYYRTTLPYKRKKPVTHIIFHRKLKNYELYR